MKYLKSILVTLSFLLTGTLECLAQRNCSIDFTDTTHRVIHLSPYIGHLKSGSMIMRLQLQAEMGIVMNCTYTLPDSSTRRWIGASEFLLEVKRGKDVVLQKTFNSFRGAFSDTVEYLQENDKVKFKNISPLFPPGIDIPEGITFVTDSLEFEIFDSGVRLDSTTQHFIDAIAHHPEIQRLNELFSQHHICDRITRSKPDVTDRFVSVYYSFTHCVDEEHPERVDHSWTFQYDKRSGRIKVIDGLKMKEFSLKEWTEHVSTIK